MIDDSIRLYRRSLFLVVHPWSTHGESLGDGTRIPMSQSDGRRFLECLLDLLCKFNVPFVELKENGVQERVKTVTDAVFRCVESVEVRGIGRKYSV